MTTEPKVHCAHAETWPIAKLVPNPRNPNRHPAEQLRLLAKIIAAQGWRSPVVVSRRSGFVIKGHGRLEAAKLGGFEVVPVDLQDYANEAEEWADMVADNRIAELAEMALPDLKEMLQELEAGGLDAELAGFTAAELDQLMAQFSIPAENKAIDEGAMAQTEHECPKCGFKW